MNEYGYCLSNPLVLVDLDGNKSIPLTCSDVRITEDTDKKEFGFNSDTYKVISDVRQLASQTNNQATSDWLYSVADEARRMAREGTPLVYAEDKISSFLFENGKHMEELGRNMDQQGLFAAIAKIKEFIKLVETNSKYDLKNQDEWQYPYTTFHGDVPNVRMNDYMYFAGMILSAEKLGNLAFGYLGAAYGFDEKFLCMGAGLYQIYSGTADFSWLSTFWDDPIDNLFIRIGILIYTNDFLSQSNCEE